MGPEDEADGQEASAGVLRGRWIKRSVAENGDAGPSVWVLRECAVGEDGRGGVEFFVSWGRVEVVESSRVGKAVL